MRFFETRLFETSVLSKTFVLLGLAVAAAACTTRNESNPPRTATEQLLISAAADRAAEKMTLDVPVPLTGQLPFPEIALFKRQERGGVAKFAGVGYDAKTGKLLGATEPQYGFSHERRYVLLLFFSWERRDFIPKEERTLPISAADRPFTERDEEQRR